MARLTALRSRLGMVPSMVRASALAAPGVEPRIRGRAGVQHRAQAMQAGQHVCALCRERGLYRTATQVDHRIPLYQGGTNDPSNLQPLCTPCHEAKTAAERAAWAKNQPISQQALDRRLPTDLPRSCIPLVMVCGPPGSGKSTYVRERMGTNDVLIDLDAIQQRMSGLPEHHTAGKVWIAPSLDERNRQLRALATDHTHDKAWFIIACPSPRERTHWASMLGATLVLLDVPLDECERRIRNDIKRAGHEERMIAAAQDWWAHNDGTRGGT